MKIFDKLLKDYIKNLSEFSRGDFIYDEFAMNGFKAGYQAAMDQIQDKAINYSRFNDTEIEVQMCRTLLEYLNREVEE